MTDEQLDYYSDPKNLRKITEAKDSEDQNTLYLEVKILKSKHFKPQSFPLLSSKNSDGIRMFENDPIEGQSYFLDHV